MTRELEDLDGNPVEVSIGQPACDAMGRWHCPFRYVRGGNEELKTAPGGDAFQALINALGCMSRDWRGKAKWSGLDYPGFPVIVDGDPHIIDYDKLWRFIDDMAAEAIARMRAEKKPP